MVQPKWLVIDIDNNIETKEITIENKTTSPWEQFTQTLSSIFSSCLVRQKRN